MARVTSVTIVDEDDEWDEGDEVVVWSNGGESLEDGARAGAGPFADDPTMMGRADDADSCSRGRRSDQGGMLIASFANLAISYNVVRPGGGC